MLCCIAGAVGGGVGGVAGAPQLPQNCLPGVIGDPHAVQVCGMPMDGEGPGATVGAPQLPQNFRPGGFGAPHDGHGCGGPIGPCCQPAGRWRLPAGDFLGLRKTKAHSATTITPPAINPIRVQSGSSKNPPEDVSSSDGGAVSAGGSDSVVKIEVTSSPPSGSEAHSFQ